MPQPVEKLNIPTSDICGKIELYIISLFLLFFLMIILTINIPICIRSNCEFIGLNELWNKNITTFLSIILLILSIFCYGRFNYKISARQNNPSLIIEIEDINYEHLVFLATYLIPLISLDISKPRYTIILFVLLIAMGMIYVKTNLFYANPSLALLGYSIYKAKVRFAPRDTRCNLILISRQKLDINMRVHSRRLDEKIYFVRIAQSNDSSRT